MTWVFLRGLAREARHWGDFPHRFQAGMGAGEILTPDLPGNGVRHLESSPTSIEAMMEACRGELREQGRGPPYHLLALSLGGMVAVAWATRYPRECKALVLLSTSLRPHNPIHQRLRPRALGALLRLAAGADRERIILELTSSRASELHPVLSDWKAWARSCPISRMNALRQLLAAARFSARQKPAVPLLLLAGAKDRMVDPRCSQTLAHIWGTKVALHPSAGHDLPLDAGDWVVGQVRDWLRAFHDD